MPLVDERTRQEFAASYPDWDMSETAISRTFRFGDFVEAVRFVVGVSLLAERADHHPDIDIRWNRVTLTLSTHSEGGLTDKDLALAEQIETRLL